MGAGLRRCKRSVSPGSPWSRRQARRTSILSARSPISGLGMALFFAPVANVVLSSVRPQEEGQASGANNAIRELGGVFGVAVLAAVFTANGGYESGQQFVNGMNAAVLIGAALVRAVGAIAAFAIKPTPLASASRPVPMRRCSRPARAPRAGARSPAIASTPKQTHRPKTATHRRRPQSL